MPRRARQYIPGLPYHIVQRGNNREACFIEPENYQFYLELWCQCLQRYGIAVHAYGLKGSDPLIVWYYNADIDRQKTGSEQLFLILTVSDIYKNLLSDPIVNTDPKYVADQRNIKFLTHDDHVAEHKRLNGK